MAYTDVDKVSAQLHGLTIDSSSTPSEYSVEQWIKEADSEIDSRTGLSFSPQPISSEIFDWEGNDDILRLSREIAEISSLYYNSESAGKTPVWTLKTEDVDYYVYGDSGEIEFIRSNFNPLSGKKRFKLFGLSGKYIVPPTVSRLSTLMVSSRVIETIIQDQSFSNSGGDVQVGTIKVGNPSDFSINSINAVKKEIDSLFDKVMGTFKSYRITRAYDL